MNEQLFYVGGRYRKTYYDAGGSLTHRPVNKGPPTAEYDDYRHVWRTPVDEARSYFDAAAILDDLGLCDLVESIVIHAQPVLDVGKQYSGRTQVRQAVAAAITALGIGLLALRNHYAAKASSQMAA